MPHFHFITQQNGYQVLYLPINVTMIGFVIFGLFSLLPLVVVLILMWVYRKRGKPAPVTTTEVKEFWEDWK